MIVLSPVVNHLGHAPDELETHRIHPLQIVAGGLSSVTGTLA